MIVNTARFCRRVFVLRAFVTACFCLHAFDLHAFVTAPHVTIEINSLLWPIPNLICSCSLADGPRVQLYTLYE